VALGLLKRSRRWNGTLVRYPVREIGLGKGFRRRNGTLRGY